MAIGKKSINDSAPTFDVVPFVMVFGGCCLAMIFFEKALKYDPKCGNFLTATELSFIAAQSFPKFLFSAKNSLIAKKAFHIQHALLWVSMSWLVNSAFNFRIAVPVHTIIRSCNVVATIVLGYLVFNVKYSMMQCFAGLLVTVGIICAAFADGKVLQASCGSRTLYSCIMQELQNDDEKQNTLISSNNNIEMSQWVVGISILLVCLMMQALLGHLQKFWYDSCAAPAGSSDDEKKSHKNALGDEFLFTSSLASLLGFVVFKDEIYHHAQVATESPLVFNFMPEQWMWIALNNFAHLMCIRGVFRLSTRYSALTVNITLSLRKFLTVVISVLYFANEWTALHSAATSFIFGGAFMYSSGAMLFKDDTTPEEQEKVDPTLLNEDSPEKNKKVQ